MGKSFNDLVAADPTMAPLARLLGLNKAAGNDPPPLAKRLAAALAVPDRVAKSGRTFGDVVKAMRSEEVRKVMAADPFANARGGLADQLDRHIVANRGDIAALPFAKAVDAIEEAYPELLPRLLGDAAVAPAGSAAGVLEKRAQRLADIVDGLTIEMARDRVLNEDATLARAVLAEEG